MCACRGYKKYDDVETHVWRVSGLAMRHTFKGGNNNMAEDRWTMLTTSSICQNEACFAITETNMVYPILHLAESWIGTDRRVRTMESIADSI